MQMKHRQPMIASKSILQLLLLNVDGVAHALDDFERLSGQGLGSGQFGQKLCGVAHWVHGTSAVVVCDADGDGSHDRISR